MKRTKIWTAAPLAVVLLAVGAFAAHAGYGDKAKKDIVDTAIAAGDFGTLVTAIKEAGLVEVLKGDGPFTVFAPTDAAFAKLPKGTLEALLADKDKLKAVLTYHVVPGKLMASDVVTKSGVQTVNGKTASISATSGAKIDNANIVKTDIVCSNGVIHVIDTVIVP